MVSVPLGILVYLLNQSFSLSFHEHCSYNTAMSIKINMIISTSEGGKNLNRLIDSKYKVLQISGFYHKKVAESQFFGQPMFSDCYGYFGSILILQIFTNIFSIFSIFWFSVPLPILSRCCCNILYTGTEDLFE